MFISNIDTLQFTLDFNDYNHNISKIADELNNKKSTAKTLAGTYASEKALFRIMDMVFEVLPNGAKGYSYILHNSDYEIKLAAVRSSNKNNYPVFVRIKQSPLWALGVEVSYQYIKYLLSSLFGTISAEKINRADLCCHTDEIPFADFDISNFKTRCTKKNLFMHGSKQSGFNFGSRSSLIYCRIYDKSLEVSESNNKAWFKDVWIDNGGDPENVWNIEFELKRDFFKEQHIETVSELLEICCGLWHYLATDWLQLTNKDRTRLENCTIFDKWVILSDSFKSLREQKSFIRCSKQREARLPGIISQMFGYLTTSAALRGITDLETAIEVSAADMINFAAIKNKDFAAIVSDKMALDTDLDECALYCRTKAGEAMI